MLNLTKAARKGRTLTTGSQWITDGHWAIRRELLSPEQQALASAGLLGGSLGGKDEPAEGTGIEERCNLWSKRTPETPALQLTNVRTDQDGTLCVWFVAVDSRAAYAIPETHWKLFGKPERAALHLGAMPLLIEERGDKAARWLCAPIDPGHREYGRDVVKLAGALAKMREPDEEAAGEESP